MHAFVMIPYQSPFEEVFNTAIKPAIETAGLTGTVVKDEHYVGAIFEKIRDLIEQARLCIADVTGGNPNVMWEAAYSQAIGKPIVFIAQGTAQAIPFDVRHNRCIIYDLTPKGLEHLRLEIAQTIAAVLKDEKSDLHLMQQITVPKSIKSLSTSFVVAVNPLSYRAAYRVARGWKVRRAVTFSDYVGIRGLMRVFGLTLGMQQLPELINPDDFDDAALDREMHLYVIGSAKSNRWAGLIMERFFANRKIKWEFRPDPESRDILNPKVIIRVNGKEYSPVGWNETNRIQKDFGIVLRGANPRDSSYMLTLLAGRSSLGTEAASLAVTEPDCIRKLTQALMYRDIDPEDHRQGFIAVVSVECEGEDTEFATIIDKFHVWDVVRC